MFRNTRAAVAVFFGINGFVFSGWASRIPQIQDQLNMTEGELGLVLLGMAVGLIMSLPVIGGVVSRYGSARVTTVSGILYALILPLLPLAPLPVILWLVLFFFGSTTGFMDIAMNAQAVEVERRRGRSIMSSFHAVFSMGGLIGAGLSSLLIEMGVDIMIHLLLMAVIAVIVLAYMSQFLLQEAPSTADNKAPIFVLPTRALLPIGLIGFCSTIGEGSMANWTSVYLKDVVDTSASLAVFGFAGFSLTMTLGRFLGDAFINRFGRVNMVRAGGMLAGIGFLLATIASEPVLAILGFALVGAGLASIIPIAFSVAGNVPGIPSGTGIAGVATLSYSGFLAGSPLIGLLADATSLRVSMAVVAGLMLFMAALAPTLHQRRSKEVYA